MPVTVGGHLNAGMTEPALDNLDRQLETTVCPPVDAPRGIEMAQRVQARVLDGSVLGDDAGGDLRRVPSHFYDRCKRDRSPLAARKHQSGFVARGGQPPFTQRVGDYRQQWDAALAGCRFQRADRMEAVGTLADVELVAGQVDIRPAQAAQFRCPQAGKDRRQQKRLVTSAAIEAGDDGPNFRRRRNVDADFEQPLLARLSRALVAGAALMGNVLCDQSAVLSVRQDAWTATPGTGILGPEPKVEIAAPVHDYRRLFSS